MITSRKAWSLMRCERMDPKKGKNIASERDGGNHQRRANHDRARREWLMREWWQGNEKEEGGLCWALVKMPIQFPVIPGFPWNVKLNKLSEFVIGIIHGRNVIKDVEKWDLRSQKASKKEKYGWGMKKRGVPSSRLFNQGSAEILKLSERKRGRGG